MGGCVKLAPAQLTVEWHWVQVCGNPPALCGGSVVASKSGRWQLTHSVGRPSKRPPAWQEEQFSVAWAPVNAKEDCE